MSRSSSALGGIVLASIAALLLSGCAPTGSTEQSPTTAKHTTASTSKATTAATASNVQFGAEPDHADAPSCSNILPDALVTAFAPSATTVQPAAGPAHTDGSEAAAVNASGFDCTVSNGISLIESVHRNTTDDPTIQGVDVTAVPDAQTMFADYVTFIGGTAQDVTTPTCQEIRASSFECSANVLVGKAWVSIDGWRTRDDTGPTSASLLPAFNAVVEHVRTRLADTGVTRLTIKDASQHATATSCTAAKVNKVASVRFQGNSDGTGSDYTATTAQAALTRAHAPWCVFTTLNGINGNSALGAAAYYTSIPNGGWAVQQRIEQGKVTTTDPVKLAGLGTHDAAWRTCDNRMCSIDIVHDRTWTRYAITTNVAANPSSAIEQWVRSSWKG